MESVMNIIPIAIGKCMKLYVRLLSLLVGFTSAVSTQLNGGVGATPAELSVTEGSGTNSYTLSLSSAPTADVEIKLEASPEIALNGYGAGASATLHFARSNWNIPRPVTITAYNDLTTEGNEYVRIRHTVSSADAAYHQSSVPDVMVTVLDNDSLPPVSNLPTVTQLPDPFLMNNGQRVSTARDWRQRRDEIKGILQYYEYGFMARAPLSWSVALISSGSWSGGMAYRYSMTLRVDATKTIAMGVNVYTPGGAGPFPVVVNIGDDSSKAAVCLPRGYMLVTYNQEDLDPDTEGSDVVGPAQAAYPEYDWGSLGVWAWGASRVMDYLETRSDVDLKHVIIRGHSRAGKAALLAGAFDERFALTAPNGAGTGGPSVYRIRNSGSETLATITGTSTFYSWFQTSFRNFANKETKLPFDQHFLDALVAPRLLLTTDATGDLWANPRGNQASREAAMRVFDFLGAGGNIGMHFRAGAHENFDEDWSAMLDFADRHFFGIPSTRDFDYRPYPTYSPSYTWNTPSFFLSRDLNKDGVIDYSDLKQFSNQWQITGPSAADLVEDFGVNFKDFAVFAATFNQRPRAYHFNTNGDFEGWTLAASLSSGVVSNGILSCDVTGADPYLNNTTPLNVAASNARGLHIRMKNSTAGSKAQFYWTTTTDVSFDERKTVTFNLVPNDSGYRDYWVDLNFAPKWGGTIRLIRFDPTVAEAGNISIELIELLPSL
jgi:hypothetical protein